MKNDMGKLIEEAPSAPITECIKLPIEHIPVSKIIIGDRCRKEMGDITGMIDSIKREGLIQPLAVQKKDGQYILAAGGRRLTSIIKQAEKEGISLDDCIVTVRVYDEISDDERNVLEMVENVYRKALTFAEDAASKKKVHDYYQRKYGMSSTAQNSGHTLKDTAQLLGMKSAGGLSDDIKLAELIEKTKDKIPWDSFKNKAQAKSMIKQAKKLAENAKAAKKVAEVSKGNRFKTLVDSYQVTDFFDGIKKVSNGSADFIELDPDYGIDVASKREGDGKVELSYREIKSSDFLSWKKKVLAECWRVLKNDSWIVNWIGIQYYNDEIKMMEDLGFKVNIVPAIWNKSNVEGVTLNPRFCLGSKFEVFIYGRKGNAEIQKPGRSNVFDYPLNRSVNERYHATQKPVELYKDVLETFARPGSLIVVPFAGSGASMVASALLNMIPIGFDLSQEHKDGYILTLNKWGIK